MNLANGALWALVAFVLGVGLLGGAPDAAEPEPVPAQVASETTDNGTLEEVVDQVKPEVAKASADQGPTPIDGL